MVERIPVGWGGHLATLCLFGLSLAGLSLPVGCIGSSSGDAGSAGSRSKAGLRRFPLDQYETARITIGAHAFRVWLARTDEQHTEGLMHVSEGEIADDQGMLFVFPQEQLLSFWMKNTITSLDIAYARMNGTIVKTYTMPPLTLRTFPSLEPALFALEVKAGTFQRLSIREGDRIIVPEEVFKTSP